MIPERLTLIVVMSCLGGACTWNNYDGTSDAGDGGPGDGGPRDAASTDGAFDAGAKPAKMPAPMRDMGVYVAKDGKIYVLGGRDAQGKASKAVNVYDPAKNTWTATFEMSTARYALGVGAFMDDKIIALGGFDDGGNAVDVVEVRDSFSGAWTLGTPMPTPRGAFAASTVPGEVVVLGGTASENGTPIGKTDWFQNNGTWSNVALLPMPTPRAWLGASWSPNGGTLAMGGAPSWATVEAFDAVQNKWTTTASSMTTGRGHFATTQGCAGSKCMQTFVVGGRSGTAVVNAFEVYDPSANAWTPLPPMPTAREGLVAAYVGSGAFAYVMAIGGYDGVNTLDIVETYNVESKTWIQK